MKRMIGVGLSMVLSLLVALPALSQSGENAAWQRIEDERDARRKAENLEGFIKTYPNSPHRPDADKMLIIYYNDNKDFAKIMNHADSFRLTQGSADAPSKAIIYTQAMMAAAALNNSNKLLEFSRDALTADPNNLTVLIMLAGNNLPDAKGARQHAEKAVTVPRPAAMAEPQWQAMQFRAHSILGGFLFAENKFKEANAEFALALKANPKDHATQYRMGYASLNLAALAAQEAQKTNNDVVAAITAKATSTANELTLKQQEFEKEALAHRDAALDSLAKAFVIGGQFVEPAKKLLDNLYQSKNKSLDGQEQFLAQKKAELGL